MHLPIYVRMKINIFVVLEKLVLILAVLELSEY